MWNKYFYEQLSYFIFFIKLRIKTVLKTLVAIFTFFYEFFMNN